MEESDPRLLKLGCFVLSAAVLCNSSGLNPSNERGRIGSAQNGLRRHAGIVGSVEPYCKYPIHSWLRCRSALVGSKQATIIEAWPALNHAGFGRGCEGP